MTTMQPDGTAGQQTWLKLGVGIVSVAVGLVLFRIAFAWPGTIFLTAFGSFVTVIALSSGVYYGVLWVLRRRATTSSPS